MPKFIDLTARLKEGMIQNHYNHPRAPLLWPSQRHDITQYDFVERWAPQDRPPLFDGLPAEAGQWGKGHGWASEQFILGGHCGTHMDAGAHFDHRDTAQYVQDIPIEKCYGEAIILDLRDRCRENYPITITDLEEAEKKTGDKVKKGDIVIIHTGWAARWAYGPNPGRWKYHEEYPGLAYDSPIWFIEREVKLVGVDTPNLDCDEVLSAHINFLLRPWINKEPIQIVENLVNLEKIPRIRFIFMGFPLPIEGSTGSPIRAVALIPDRGSDEKR